jgi:hypothetical protein
MSDTRFGASKDAAYHFGDEQHSFGHIRIHRCWLGRLVLSRRTEARRPWLETQAGVRFRLILARLCGIVVGAG